ncbi:MAG TPA: right-handed parallel beta-helix repeat-containing protein [Saprospiraceae bacterium]|nr:right-handed parallel beta-helix repeat-containing protein [Saprospiraceae bacterium]
MKKILFFAFLQILVAQSQAATWYVAPNGNDNNPGALASPFKTLPAAIEAANPGDDIVLRGGNYTSQEIRINKNDLHIKSYPGEWAVITAVTNIEDVSACLWYNEPETTGGSLERLEIVGGYYYAIKFETNWDWDNSVPFSQRRGVSHVTVKDCIIHHSGRDAIKLTPACAHISILNCEIHHTGVGPGAQLDFNAEGIDNVNAPDLTVRGCYFHDIATTGVYVKGGGRNCIIEQNRIENCGEGGIYLGFYTDAEWFDTDFNPQYFENVNGLVLNNLIVNTQHAGIGLWGAKDAQVYNNTVINGGQAEHAALFFNTTDVWIDDNNSARVGSQNVHIQNNIFVQAAGQDLAMVRVRENALPGSTNVVDNNFYYDPNGAVFLDDNLDWQEWTLAQWNAHTFRDLHSFTADPKLNDSFHLLADSPCIDAGANLAGVDHDLDGQLRSDGANDIGADEFGAVSAVSGPSQTVDLSVKMVGNPVAEWLTVQVSAEQSGDMPAQIIGLDGTVLAEQLLPVTPGTEQHILTVGHLTAGTYLLRLGSTVVVWVKM